jgi:hypothetical protein
MSIFDLARRPPTWLRVALVAVVLAFALDSVAHVVQHQYASLTAVLVAGYIAPVAQFPVSLRTRLSAQPRAPPR